MQSTNSNNNNFSNTQKLQRTRESTEEKWEGVNKEMKVLVIVLVSRVLKKGRLLTKGSENPCFSSSLRVTSTTTVMR